MLHARKRDSKAELSETPFCPKSSGSLVRSMKWRIHAPVLPKVAALGPPCGNWRFIVLSASKHPNG
eukprot:1750305-Amphidinium_carterae.1